MRRDAGGEGGGPIRSALRHAASFAETRDLEVFVVGGFVRDRLLGLEPADLDLVWLGRGDPRAVSEALGRELSATVSYRSRFLTASLEFEGARIDLGRARAESYPSPAALPLVREGSLAEDLNRRDFTVNALAWPIAAAVEPEPTEDALIDLCGGASDLEDRLLRTLHERSFRDDPTRILRGLDLANRRSMTFEKGTLEQARAELEAGAIDRLSEARLRHEIERLFRRPAGWLGAAGELHRLRADRRIDRAFEIDRPAVERLREAARREASSSLRSGDQNGGHWLIAIALLVWARTIAERQRIARRLGLGRAAAALLSGGPDRVEEAHRKLAAVDFSAMEATRTCGRLSPDELRLLTGVAGPRALDRLREVRGRLEIELTISGDDLLRVGATPGPRLGETLERTLAARRGGKIEAADELAHALEWLTSQGGDKRV